MLIRKTSSILLANSVSKLLSVRKPYKKRRKAKKSRDVLNSLQDDASKTSINSQIYSTKRIEFDDVGEIKSLYAADNWDVGRFPHLKVIPSFLIVLAGRKSVQDTSLLQTYVPNRGLHRNLESQTLRILILYPTLQKMS
uniref:Uncharacterized protein n=1 Tax=Schistosoma haematobium TaxID=6185 RepID=A0A095C6U9_SCHHA